MRTRDSVIDGLRRVTAFRDGNIAVNLCEFCAPLIADAIELQVARLSPHNQCRGCGSAASDRVQVSMYRLACSALKLDATSAAQPDASAGIYPPWPTP